MFGNNLILYFGSLVTFAFAIRVYTKDLDDDLCVDIRESLSLRLMCLDDPDNTSFFEWASKIVDMLFGKRHLSWRCFLLSSMISSFSFTSFFLVMATSNPGFNVITDIISSFPILILIVGIVVNVPSDYFALFETRWVIKTKLPAYLKIIVDFVLTYLIGIGWFALLVGLFFSPELGIQTFTVIWIDPIALGSGIEYAVDYNSDQSFNQILAYTLLDITIFYIFVSRTIMFTSYVTSVWVWLYGLSDFFIRAMSRNHHLVKYLNIENKPVRALGLMISLFVLLLGTIAYVIATLTLT